MRNSTCKENSTFLSIPLQTAPRLHFEQGLEYLYKIKYQMA